MVFTMNSGQYQHLPQMHSLATDFQYDNGEDLVQAQSSHPMFSCDGLPRTSSQHLMNSTSLAANNLSTSYNLLHPIPMSRSSIAWEGNGQHSGGFEDQTGNNYYGYGSNFSSGNEHNGSSFLRGSGFHSQQQVPRFLPNMFNNNNMPLENSYEPTYILDTSKNGLQSPNSNAMGSPFDYQSMNNVQDLNRLSICNSPAPKMEPDDDVMSFERPPPFGLTSSESSEEGNNSREMTAIEFEDRNVDEPYAKLIYRALMSAPNHSMVLQEIYQWFRENTQKGSSDTKGWMNSIRHNLSMNAAFKKTERTTPDNETKKSTEWVLEEFAIRDGVQSTTRYRKGTGAKKFIKTEHPSPARISSGRKGGMSTKHAKLHLQRQHRPSKDDLRQGRSSDHHSHPTRATQRIDGVRRSQFQHQQQQQARSQISQRQRSPLTPPSAVGNIAAANPYFFPKVEQFDMPIEDMYRLEDIQGVCVDDSPLFSSGPDDQFQSGRSMSNHRY